MRTLQLHFSRARAAKFHKILNSRKAFNIGQHQQGQASYVGNFLKYPNVFLRFSSQLVLYNLCNDVNMSVFRTHRLCLWQLNQLLVLDEHEVGRMNVDEDKTHFFWCHRPPLKVSE